MRRADDVAAGDGGQPLHMRSEQIGEGCRLRLAELRELCRHMGYWAMVLAQLGTGSDVLRRRGVTLPAQRVGKCLSPPRGIRFGDHHLPVATDKVADPLLSEQTNGLLATVLGQETQRGDRQVIVGVPEPGPPRRGEEEQLGWTATATATARWRRTGHRLPVREECVEMATHRSRTDPERLGNLRSRHRPALQQNPGH